MREIKFRAWNKEEKIYHYNAQNTYDYGNDDVKPPIMDNSFGDVLKDKNYIIEKYTGLTDKNGVEIYEGDVLQGIATGGSESYNDLILRVYQGVDGAFRYEIKHKEKWKRSAYQTIHSLVSDKTKKYYNVKVIGNIHE